MRRRVMQRRLMQRRAQTRWRSAPLLLQLSRNSRRAARDDFAVRISRARAEVLAGQRLQQQNILDCTGDCHSSVQQLMRRADAISTDVRRGRQEPGTCAVPPTAAAIAYANDAEKEWHQRHIAMRFYAAGSGIKTNSGAMIKVQVSRGNLHVNQFSRHTYYNTQVWASTRLAIAVILFNYSVTYRFTYHVFVKSYTTVTVRVDPGACSEA